jgi:secreted trypsin-like serine protease
LGYQHSGRILRVQICGKQFMYGVYTRVSAQREWITGVDHDG